MRIFLAALMLSCCITPALFAQNGRASMSASPPEKVVSSKAVMKQDGRNSDFARGGSMAKDGIGLAPQSKITMDVKEPYDEQHATIYSKKNCNRDKLTLQEKRECAIDKKAKGKINALTGGE